MPSLLLCTHIVSLKHFSILNTNTMISYVTHMRCLMSHMKESRVTVEGEDAVDGEVRLVGESNHHEPNKYPLQLDVHHFL